MSLWQVLQSTVSTGTYKASRMFPKWSSHHIRLIRLYNTSHWIWIHPPRLLQLSLDPNRSSAERSRSPSTFPGLEVGKVSMRIDAQPGWNRGPSFQHPTPQKKDMHVSGKVSYTQKKQREESRKVHVSSKFQRHHFCVSGNEQTQQNLALPVTWLN